MNIKLSFIFVFLFCNATFGQLLFYQDVFHGGVTGDNIDPFTTLVPQTFHVHIPPNSVMRKAYIFVTTSKTKYPNIDSVFYDRKITFNGHEILLKHEDTITDILLISPTSHVFHIGVIPINVIDFVSPSQNNYTLIL